MAAAAGAADLGTLQRRYRRPIGLQIYWAIMFAIFALVPAVGGAPTYIVAVPGSASITLLTVAAVIWPNRLVYLYQHGMVITAINRQVKMCARWEQIATLQWTDRSVSDHL